jgi:proline iminopeptidase
VACDDRRVGSGPVADLVPMSDGCRLWTQTTGTGRPAVLCHGGPGLWDYLLPLARLAGPGYRVHRYDQRGCGRSGHQRPWTLAQLISDLDGLRAHFGYRRWVVAGHSFGADLALRYALRYPHRVTAVVYICGTGLEWSTHRGVHKAAARARRSQREQDRLATLAAWQRTAGQEREFLTLTWAADYADHALGLKAASGMAAAGLPVNYQLSKVINEELKAESPHALAAACQALTVPVLLLQGGQDPRPAAACDSLASALPAATRITLPRAGHLPWTEAPEKVSVILRDFLTHLNDDTPV